jgi:hypothetical protein
MGMLLIKRKGLNDYTIQPFSFDLIYF